MDFNLNRETFKQMFPLGLIGLFIGFGLGLIFVVFSDLFAMIFSFLAFLFAFLNYTRKPLIRIKVPSNGMDKVRKARKPCPDCGSLTIHKKDCPRRKPKP